MEKIKPKTYKTMIDALYVPPFEEPEFGPSMVEPCHNLSIAEILADYSRGIVHSQREGIYDDGDDLPDEIAEFEDFVDIQNPVIPKPSASADGLGREVGKPSGTEEAKQSEGDEGKEGPGTEAD